MKNFKINNMVKNGESTKVCNSYAEFLRSCKERYEADKSPRCCPVEICDEHYEKISSILRHFGYEDVPVGAYIESVLVDMEQRFGEAYMIELAKRAAGYEYN